jgi:hypothetical protein
MQRTILTFALLLVPVVSFAHGDSPSFEKQVGPYLIDIGYDRLGFRPGEDVTFSFDLYRTDGPAPAFEPFQTVRMEITKEGQIIEAREIENERNFIPSTVYAFPEAGDYGFYAAFVQSGSIVAQAVFDAPVGDHNGNVGRAMNMGKYIAAIALTLFALFVIIRSFLLRKKA